MPEFNRNMLPCVGVVWHYFPTMDEAQSFANWAEDETADDEWPCEAFVMRDDDRPDAERWEVKVRNW
jgi:hypothetical protein